MKLQENIEHITTDLQRRYKHQLPLIDGLPVQLVGQLVTQALQKMEAEDTLAARRGVKLVRLPMKMKSLIHSAMPAESKRGVYEQLLKGAERFVPSAHLARNPVEKKKLIWERLRYEATVEYVAFHIARCCMSGLN